MATLYYGANGVVLRATSGTTQATSGPDTTPPVTVVTWDAIPAGESGDVAFRSTDWTFEATNGYTVTITPSVDGVALSPQTFTRQGSGVFTEQAWLGDGTGRGTRLQVEASLTDYDGPVRIQQATWTAAILRTTP